MRGTSGIGLPRQLSEAIERRIAECILLRRYAELTGIVKAIQ